MTKIQGNFKYFSTLATHKCTTQPVEKHCCRIIALPTIKKHFRESVNNAARHGASDEIWEAADEKKEPFQSKHKIKSMIFHIFPVPSLPLAVNCSQYANLFMMFYKSFIIYALAKADAFNRIQIFRIKRFHGFFFTQRDPWSSTCDTHKRFILNLSMIIFLR